MSDIVTIHISLTNETKHLIDKEKLALMKPSAFLINTAVGPIVDNDALAEALHNGVIAGAGLDRVDMEPPVPDRKSTRLNSSHVRISYAVFCLKKKKKKKIHQH